MMMMRLLCLLENEGEDEHNSYLDAYSGSHNGQEWTPRDAGLVRIKKDRSHSENRGDGGKDCRNYGNPWWHRNKQNHDEDCQHHEEDQHRDDEEHSDGQVVTA